MVLGSIHEFENDRCLWRRKRLLLKPHGMHYFEFSNSNQEARATMLFGLISS